MRKMKKTLALLAIVAMVLTMIPLQVFADTDSTRLAGADRIATAIAIADAFGSADTVILAAADDANLVDSLAVAPLAGKVSPIYLTYKNSLDAAVKAKLSGKKVIAIGAVSDAVVADAQTVAASVEKVSGADRLATNDLINAKLTNPAGTFVVGYNAIPDALSVASFAAANNYAIVLANPDGSVDSAKIKGSNTYVIGGPTLVNDITGATRLYGADRFATNTEVVKALTYSYDKAYIANGNSLVDALAASSLAAKAGAAVLLTDGSSVAAASTINAKLTSSSEVIALGGTGVVSDAVQASVGYNVPTPGTLSVKSVSAASANSLKVVFNQAPADTSKVVFTVTRSTTPITITTSWNDAKTEATLTGASNLPEGTYSVAVKNDTTDLGTSTVSVTAQKIAKISITSTKLAVTQSVGATLGKGYATYQVFDQYGNDITTSYLSNNVTFQCGVGSVNSRDGLITVTPTGTTSLIQYSTVVITGYDSSTGVSTNATLTTSTALGTLSNLTLNKITNVDNKDLTAGDTASVWYIDYTATDISGNSTKDYNLVKNGLILTGANNDELTTSNSYVTAQIVQDPSDTTKGAIKVTVKSTDSISTDMPVIITALTYAGTSSTLNTTLKKASTPETFTLMAPSYDIASKEYKEIPFICYDQNGTQLTKFDDINGVTLSPLVTTGAGGVKSPGIELIRNTDGTASVMMQALENTGTQSVSQTVTAVTSTGKLSTLTVNIQPTVKADTLTLDSSKLVNAMQVNAAQTIDFGYNYGGLEVKDQYDRDIDMTGKPGNYLILASPSGSVTAVGSDGNKDDIVVGGNPGNPIAYGANGIRIKADVTAGTGTVIFKVVDITQKDAVTGLNIITAADLALPGGLSNLTAKTDLEKLTVIDSRSVTFSVIQNKDIKGYTIDTVAKPILCTAPVGTAGGAITNAVGGLYDRHDDYAANPYVYGKTSSGSKVVLAGTPIISVNSSSTDFITDGTATSTTPIAYDKVKLVALKFADSAKTGSSTTLTVILIAAADNNVTTVTTPVTSTTSAAVASNIDAYVDTTIAGVSQNDAHDTVYLTVAAATTVLANNQVLARENAAGDKTDRAAIYFYSTDQYGSKAAQLANVLLVSKTIAAAGNFSVGSDGTITNTLANFTVGDTMTLSGVTNTGLVKTIKIVIQ